MDRPLRQQRHSQQGFTLIELIVVIALLGLTLTFIIPSLKVPQRPEDQKDFPAWLSLQLTKIKTKAYHEQQTYTLHLNLTEGRFWLTSRTMTKEEKDQAAERSSAFPKGAVLGAVSFPDGVRIETGTALINFYKQGYSDLALLHLQDASEKPITLRIEPFLDQPLWVDGHAGFE